MDPGDDQTVAIDFLARLLDDRARGRPRPLADYLALYPGREDTIAEEWERARAPEAADAQANGSSAAPLEGELRRVGRFRLVAELGRGGQASVWRAFDERLQRAVALKIAPASALFEDLAPRLRREAQAAARLAHPGLCTVLDVGCDEGVGWIAMQLVEGETLACRLERERAELASGGAGRRPASGGARDERAAASARLATAMEQVEQAARALHAAHEAGVVHRDVKPGNLMVGPRGEVVVLDFGLALSDEDGAPLTLAGAAPGTPAYMPPEVLRRGGTRPDRRADVWALGVTLYEALTLQRPFAAASREELVRAILHEEPADPRRLQPALARDAATVVLAALAKEPDRRYQSALDLAEDLAAALAGRPIRARRPGALGRAARWARRNPALAASLGGLVLALTAGLAVSTALLARTRAVLRESDALLSDFVQLSDQRVARELAERAAALWPARPERVAGLERWLAEAGAVLARLPAHRAALEESERRERGEEPARATLANGAVGESWLLEQRRALVAALEALEGSAASVRERLDFARTVRERSVEAPRAAWERARAAVAADPRFAGLELRPQLGLLPLGPDPASGLQEFAHLASGAPAVRDPESGKLRLDKESGLVLVLVPGGATSIGAEPPSAGRAAGAPHADPQAGEWDGPVTSVRLDPYFLAKHEMTQAQWTRHAGANPASYGEGSRFVPESPALNPVETVSWELAARVAAELDLALPTEAQWERAARGGTTSPWWTGADALALAGCANLADDHARAHGGHENWRYEPGFDDGHVVHAPVGRFRPNPFGLHDVIGNVGEWCRDTWEDWRTAVPRPGDGLFSESESARVFRGGSYSGNADRGRSAARDGLRADMASYSVGLRPARSLDPDG